MGMDKNEKVEYKIISANEFLRAKPSGEFDREESKKVLVEIVEVAISHADGELMLDVREAYGKLTFVDIYEFVAELGKHITDFRNKIAVLSRQDDRQFDNSKFMELCAKNRGFHVEAFTNFEESINWLTTSVDIEINNPS